MKELRRVIAGRLALTLINRSQIKEGDFDRHEGGSVLLDDDGRKKVITACQERKQEALEQEPIGAISEVEDNLRF